MKTTRSSTLIPLAVLIAFFVPAAAQKDAGQQGASPDFAALEAAQNAANAMPGPRTVPGRSIPVPRTASPELQATIAAPYRVPNWNANPKNAAEWKELINGLAVAGASARREVREKLGITMEPTVIGGVNAFILSPKEMLPANRNRLLVHVHGGGYVYNPGEAGTGEAASMAGYGGFKVISIDYRMPPDHPYPTAMDERHGGLAGGGQAGRPTQHGDLWDLDRRRHDAGDDPARQAGRFAASGGDRARHAMVGFD